MDRNATRDSMPEESESEPPFNSVDPRKPPEKSGEKKEPHEEGGWRPTGLGDPLHISQVRYETDHSRYDR